MMASYVENLLCPTWFSHAEGPYWLTLKVRARSRLAGGASLLIEGLAICFQHHKCFTTFSVVVKYKYRSAYLCLHRNSSWRGCI